MVNPSDEAIKHKMKPYQPKYYGVHGAESEQPVAVTLVTRPERAEMYSQVADLLSSTNEEKIAVDICDFTLEKDVERYAQASLRRVLSRSSAETVMDHTFNREPYNTLDAIRKNIIQGAVDRGLIGVIIQRSGPGDLKVFWDSVRQTTGGDSI